MNRSLLALVLAGAAVALAAPVARAADPVSVTVTDSTAADTSHVSDPQALAIADQVMKALGGNERWDKLHGIRWTWEFTVNDTVKSLRKHSWDKMTGWHRISGKTRTGVDFVFIHKLNTPEGMAWMNGVKIEGDSLQKLMKRANSVWINDAYWFLMPYKLRDPGVTLKYAGQVRDGDNLYDKLGLSFDHVGDTPGDRYWVYVNRANHRIDKWEMMLQGDQPPPTLYQLEGWEQHQDLWFCTAKRGDQGRVIYTRNVETVSAFPAAEFTAP